jgi:hypothetical protein
MRDRFGKMPDPGAATLMVLTFNPIARPAVETAETVKWGNIALSKLEGARVLGGALYRDGQYAAVIAHYQKVAKTGALGMDDDLFLAMAQYHLKQADARKTFDAAIERINKAERVLAKGVYWSWFDQIRVRRLRKEAEALFHAQ